MQNISDSKSDTLSNNKNCQKMKEKKNTKDVLSQEL